MKSAFFIGLFLFVFFKSDQVYIKKYFANGKLMEEGWRINDKKSGYWFYYFENGIKKEEGHYNIDQKVKWWIYYDNQQQIVRKCEYKSDVLNGLTLIYKDNKIVLIEKFNMGKKVKSWDKLAAFKKDNP